MHLAPISSNYFRILFWKITTDNTAFVTAAIFSATISCFANTAHVATAAAASAAAAAVAAAAATAAGAAATAAGSDDDDDDDDDDDNEDDNAATYTIAVVKKFDI